MSRAPSRRWVAALACLAIACAGPTSHASDTGRPAGSGAALEDATPRPYEEEEVDLPPRPIAPIEPVYPPALRALGVEGDVVARVVVLADGSVGGAELVASGDVAFTAAVREALKTARFHPARRGGQPVPSWVTLRLRFRLEQ